MTLHERNAIRELVAALRLTVEYVGFEMLPPITGWSWYEAMVKYAPAEAQLLTDAWEKSRIENTVYNDQLSTKGNTMNEQVKPQGVFITAEFDRIVSRERRDKDNKIIVTKYVGLIARSDESTELYLVRTGRPEKYANVKRNEMLTLKVNVRSFRDVIYYSEV